MTRGCEWRHAPEAYTEDFGRFEKSQLGFCGLTEELSSASGEDGWLSQARRGLALDAHVVWGR